MFLSECSTLAGMVTAPYKQQWPCNDLWIITLYYQAPDNTRDNIAQ